MLSPEMKGNCPPELPECESLTHMGPSVSAQERAIQHPDSSHIIPALLRGTEGLCGGQCLARGTQNAALCLLMGSNGTLPASWESQAHVLVPLYSGALSRVHVQHPGRVMVSQRSVQVWGPGNQGHVPALPFWPPGAGVSLTTLRCSRICMCLHPHEDNSAHSFLICWKPCICTGTGIDSFSDS